MKYFRLSTRVILKNITESAFEVLEAGENPTHNRLGRGEQVCDTPMCDLFHETIKRGCRRCVPI